MKKFVVFLLSAAITLPVLAQIKSSLIRNTVNTEVFSVEYGAGPATVNVPGGTIVASALTVPGHVPVISSTATNIDLTAIAPAAAGQLLLTPNSTNTFVVVDDDSNDAVFLLRVAINIDGTTNGWVKLATDKQP